MNPQGEDSNNSLVEGLQSYVRARVQLLSIESQEALDYLKQKALPLVLVLVCALVAYLLLIAAAVSLLGQILSSFGKHALLGWELAAVLIGGLHLLVLFRMAKRLQRAPEEPLFQYTRTELERDREWLQENKPGKKS